MFKLFMLMNGLICCEADFYIFGCLGPLPLPNLLISSCNSFLYTRMFLSRELWLRPLFGIPCDRPSACCCCNSWLYICCIFVSFYL